MALSFARTPGAGTEVTMDPLTVKASFTAVGRWSWTEPMSTTPPEGRARPRWSVAGAPMGLPAPSAGLPGRGGSVPVGPP